MAWHQSHMFSSTAQILEVYLQPSPAPSESGSIAMRWTPIDATIPKEKSTGSKTSNLTSHPYSKSTLTTPRTSLTDSSSASSPASSYTTYSSDSQSTKKNNSPEIRRRRLPEGVEPRVKNLALKKSNGATNFVLPPPIADAALTGASSNYSRSPTMDSPAHLPPALPAKAPGRSVQRKPINRKPLGLDQEIHASPTTMSEADVTARVEDTPFPSYREQAQKQSDVTSPKLQERPPRTTSLDKSHPPVVGRRPVPIHKKTLSTAASNKDLPPDPPIDRRLLPQNSHIKKKSESSSSNTAEKADSVSSRYAVHSRGQSDPTNEKVGLPQAPKGLPSGPKLRSGTGVTRRPLPIKEDAKPQTEESVAEPLSRGGPALGSLSKGPKPAQKPKHQVSASLSSLTSATVSGPIPLPDFQLHSRAESDVNTSSLRSQSRERSRPRAASEEMITIAMDPRPVQAHRPTLSQTSSRSEPYGISRSTTPQSQRSVSTAATSISSLPGVPEVQTPLIAPEIKPSHFTCYTQHRPLVASSNHTTRILCMTCKQDSDKMWGCGWCHLRICTGCKDGLVEVRNDLRKMLDEAAAGTLIIGKERIPMPPFLGEVGNRSRGGSETSSMRSYGSAGSRPMHSRGQGPVFAPPQAPYLRQERSMDSLQGRSGPRNPYGPPRGYRGPPPPPAPQQMRNQPLDYIGMPSMNNRPRQPMPMQGQAPRSKPSTAPQSPNMTTPTFGPVSLGFPTSNNDNNTTSNNMNMNMAQIPPPNRRFQPGPPPQQGPYNPYQNPGNMRRAGPPNTRGPRNNAGGDDDFMPPMLDLSLDAGAGPMAAGLRGLNLGGASRPMPAGAYSGHPGARARGMT